MKTLRNYNILSYALIFIAFLSLFLGFYFDENSAGAGTYEGDIKNIWNNLQIFIVNDIASAIESDGYYSSRTPAFYLFNKIFNPFTENIISFRRSVFIISLSIPFLFYFCLKQKFLKENNILLLLIASTLCLSPYYRTSSFWGLEENYGLIFLLLTYLSLNSFLKKEKEYGYKIHLLLFLSTFFSSCCLYFDQKLIIITIICFTKIIFSEKPNKLKLLCFFYYLIFSLPYIYLISIWGGLLPDQILSESRQIGNKIFLIHVGYAMTIIAFYFLPLLSFKKENVKNQTRDFFVKKTNYYIIFLFLIYLIYLILFYDFNEQAVIGKGIIHKISIMLFADNFFRALFIYFSFFISLIIILTFVEKRFIDILTISYLCILSLLLWPIFQEYFDPLILLMVFTFFNTKLIINYKNVTILYIYLSILLVGSNIYYTNLLNG
tara:strand:+ start:1367 stop:2671 length:1305 start_codon:yes stop_codon:yes gene_type:complete